MNVQTFIKTNKSTISWTVIIISINDEGFPKYYSFVILSKYFDILILEL